MSDENTTPVAEIKAKPVKEKATLEQLLAQYVELQSEKGKVPADEFDNRGRALRRQIRAAGGSVNSLKPAVEPKAEGEPKPKREKKAKVKGARLETDLGGDPRAQPAGRAHVEWLEGVLNGTREIKDGAEQIQPLEQRTMAQLETSGEYGYGVDVLSDVLPRQLIAKFTESFGYAPTWFAIHKPDNFDIPTALTLLILGPAPAAEETPVVTVEAEADEPIESPDGDEEVDDSWGDEDPEESDED